MKLFGQIIAGIAVMILAGLAIFGIVSLSTNNTKNETTTLSITEARELVEKAYTASKGSSSVSTVATYDKDYVENDTATWAAGVLEQFNEILKKCDGEVGKVKFPDQGAEVYVSYQLTEKGVKCGMFWLADNKIYSRSFVDLYYESKNEDLWSFTLSMLRSSSGTFNNDETEQSFNEYMDEIDCRGVGKKLRKYEGGTILVNQSFFGTNVLNKDNVQGVTLDCLDGINHEQFKKGYRVNENIAKEVDWTEYEDFTDAEINQIVSARQNHIKTNYARQVTGLDKYVSVNN